MCANNDFNLSEAEAGDNDLPEAPRTKTFRSWVFDVVMAGLNEGYALEDIAEWIKAYGKDRGYSRYRIYRELKRKGMIPLKRYHNPKLMTTEERLEQFRKLVLDAIEECWDESIYDEHTPPEEYDYEAHGEEEPGSIDVDNEFYDDPNPNKPRGYRQLTKREQMGKMGSDAFYRGWLIDATARRQKELELEGEELRREREWRGRQQEQDDEAEE